MADNYLERKMDEYRRNGGTAPKYRSRPAAIPGLPRRIVVIADGRSFLKQYAAPFTALQCRVAVINTLTDAETDLGADYGLRYRHIASGADIPAAIADIAKAWLDIDAAILLDPVPEALSALETYTAGRLIPRPEGLPAVLVSDSALNRLNLSAPLPDPASNPHSTLLHDLSPVPDADARPESAHVLYMTLPRCADISVIRLK